MPAQRNTSLPLIMLTLLVGIALGWLLYEFIGGAGQSPPIDQRSGASGQRSTAPPPAQIAPTISAAPTAMPPSTAVPSALVIAPIAAPTTAAPSAAPTTAVLKYAGYAGHVMSAGETLETIAASGGSTAALIARYNLLDGEPRPGRMLIVPRLAGKTNSLESAPLLVQRGRTDRPWVALTLDAGAGADAVPSMLKTLREHNVKITFFLTGKWIKENPDLTRQIVADGHEIANHTFTHPDMRNLNDAAIRKELADTETLLAETAGATARPFFRPPYGAYDERVLRLTVGQGYLPIYWTLDSLDSVGEPKTPEFLFDRITAKLSPEKLRGAIILAHCGSQPTADALPKILDRFAEMGFELKKVSEILGS